MGSLTALQDIAAPLVMQLITGATTSSIFTVRLDALHEIHPDH
jgi:hypothetical protein